MLEDVVGGVLDQLGQRRLEIAALELEQQLTQPAGDRVERLVQLVELRGDVRDGLRRQLRHPSLHESQPEHGRGQRLHRLVVHVRRDPCPFGLLGVDQAAGQEAALPGNISQRLRAVEDVQGVGDVLGRSFEQSLHLLVERLGSPRVDRQRADDVPAPTEGQRGGGRDAANALRGRRLGGVLRAAQLHHPRRHVTARARGRLGQHELVDVVVEGARTRHPHDATVRGDRGDPRAQVAGLVDRHPAGLREQLEVVGRPDDRLVHLREAAVGPGQRLHPDLVVATCADVGDRRDHPEPVGGLERRQVDLRGELAAVLAAATELQAL